MGGERSLLRDVPWREFLERHRTCTREQFLDSYPSPFLLVGPLNASAAERLPGPTTLDLKNPDTDKVEGVEAEIRVPLDLQLADGECDRRVFEVVRKPGPRTYPHITLGRTPANDIVLPAPAVSKCHALFKESPPGTFFLIDGKSTNGTWVDAQRLAPYEGVLLRNAAQIQIADAYAADFYSPAGLFRLVFAGASHSS